jgi:hypothetical protein
MELIWFKSPVILDKNVLKGTSPKRVGVAMRKSGFVPSILTIEFPFPLNGLQRSWV